MRVSTWGSLAGMLIAFLASQHHLLHMIMLTIGFGSAGMTGMMMSGTVRRSMLVLSLGMVGVALWRVRQPGRPRHVRLLSSASAVATLGLAAYSVFQYGW